MFVDNVLSARWALRDGPRCVQHIHCGHEMNRENGGLYIISDLCHYVSSKETYTKMNIIRDSFGRKPKGR